MRADLEASSSHLNSSNFSNIKPKPPKWSIKVPGMNPHCSICDVPNIATQEHRISNSMLVRINASTLVNQILDCQFFRDLKFMVSGQHDNPGYSEPDDLLVAGRTRAQEQKAQQRNFHMY